MAIIFRVGWIVRSVHSLFDYVQGSPEMDNEAGRQLSGWRGMRGDGGITPTAPEDVVENGGMVYHQQGDSNVTREAGNGTEETSNGTQPNDIETQQQVMQAKIRKMKGFCFAGLGLSTEVQSILLAAMMKYWGAVLISIDQNPNQEEVKDNPIVKVVQTHLRSSGISDDEWDDWCCNVRNNFIRKNWNALPSGLLRDVDENTMLDPRTVRDEFLSINRGLNRLTEDNLQKQNRDRHVDSRLSALESQVDRIEGHIIRLMNFHQVPIEDNEVGGVVDSVAPMSPRPKMDYHIWWNSQRRGSMKKIVVAPTELFANWIFFNFEAQNQKLNDRSTKTCHGQVVK